METPPAPPPMTSAEAQALIVMMGDLLPVLLVLLVAFLALMLGRWAGSARSV